MKDSATYTIRGERFAITRETAGCRDPDQAHGQSGQTFQAGSWSDNAQIEPLITLDVIY
jgi:hypothetical protein